MYFPGLAAVVKLTCWLDIRVTSRLLFGVREARTEPLDWEKAGHIETQQLGIAP